jgi:Ca-activated chloride channel family protein
MSNHDQSHRPRWGILKCVLVAAMLAATAHASTHDPGPGTGELELITAAGRYAVPAVRTDVRLEVTGPLVHAVVRQDFTNPASEIVSARYVFPLPEYAAVSAMELLVGERRIVSVVKEKEAARAVYEKARQEGRKAALVASAQGNLFVTEVANIGPGEKVSVRLEYLDQAAYEDGWFSLTYPLTFTPRFFPPAAGEGAESVAVARHAVESVPFAPPGSAAFPEASIEVSLAPGLELADVLSPSHAVSAAQEQGSWWLQLEPRLVPADRDFILRWRPVSDPLARPVLFVEEGPGGLYGLLMVVPGDPDPTAPRPPTDTVFLLDVSGSMGGSSIDQARQALTAAVNELHPGDRFNLLEFNDRTSSWRDHLAPVQAPALQAARDWVRRREANGGTMLHPALLQARLSCGQSAEPGRARQIILLTDAAVGNEAQLLSETIAGLGDLRLHVVGIGHAPNRYLVRRLAGEGGGQPLFITGHGSDAGRLSAFLTRIGRPQWANPRLEWDGNPQVDGYPARLPAPVPGELVLWSGRFPVGTDLEGVLRADGGAGDLGLRLEAIAAPEGSGLATRWAQRRVDDLLAALDSGGDGEELRAAVVTTALEHGLVTRFTSRVAVELVRTVDEPGPTRDVPAGLPKGSELLGQLPAGGTLEDLWRLLGAVLLLTGMLIWVGQRRRCAS